MGFPPCPESLKAIAHYLKVADEHDTRDIVVSYWCRLHALEIGMKIVTTKTPEVNNLLIALMDWLEKTKSEQANNEGITSKVCAQATLENYALKLFKYADEQDRAENYGKNVVKAFYTTGIIMDVLTSFGDLSEDVAEKRKYAKWKAAYIHNCLKAGERPVPGPLENSEDNDDFMPVAPPPSANTPPSPDAFPSPPTGNNMPAANNAPAWNIPPPVNPSAFVPVPAQIPTPLPTLAQISTPTPISISTSSSVASLNAEQIAKAQKYCKWASSALNYDDVKSAVENLQKALILLQTGKESPE